MHLQIRRLPSDPGFHQESPSGSIPQLTNQVRQGLGPHH